MKNFGILFLAGHKVSSIAISQVVDFNEKKQKI